MKLKLTTALGTVLLAAAPAFADKAAVLDNYADIALAKYTDSLTTAQMLLASVNTLTDAPSAEALQAAKDAWLAALFSDQMATGADYVRCSTKLQGIMRPHVVDLLNAGVSVVLDYAANTVASRAWMRGILQAPQAAHKMHVRDVTAAVCLARLRQRAGVSDGSTASADPGNASSLKSSSTSLSASPGPTRPASGLLGPGVSGVIFVEFFSEVAGGGVSMAEILGGGPLPVASD